MRHFLWAVGLLMGLSSLWGQCLSPEWIVTENLGYEALSPEFRLALVDEAGNSYHLGENPLRKVYSLISLSPSGEVRWDAWINWVEINQRFMRFDRNNNLLVGFYDGLTVGLFRYRRDGQLLESRYIPVSPRELREPNRLYWSFTPYALYIDEAENLYLGTSFGGVAKLNAQGQVLWVVPLPDYNIHDFLILSDGTVYLTGGTPTRDSMLNYVVRRLIRIAPSGQIAWSETGQTITTFTKWLGQEQVSPYRVVFHDVSGVFWVGPNGVEQYRYFVLPGLSIVYGQDGFLCPDGHVFGAGVGSPINTFGNSPWAIGWTSSGVRTFVWVGAPSSSLDFGGIRIGFVNNRTLAVWSGWSGSSGSFFRLEALDTVSGGLLWSQQFEAQLPYVMQVVPVERVSEAIAIGSERQGARLVRFAHDGTIRYNRLIRHTVPSEDRVSALVPSGSGGLFVKVGSKLLHYSMDGRTLWSVTADGQLYSDGNGNALLLDFIPNGDSGHDWRLTCYRPDGTVVWRRVYAIPEDQAYAQTVLSDGAMIHIISQAGWTRIWARVSHQGELMGWTNFGEVTGLNATLTPEGDIAFTYISGANLYVVRYAPTGERRWVYRQNINASVYQLIADSTGGLYLSVSVRVEGRSQGRLYRFLPDGTLAWEVSIGSPSDIQLAPHDGVYAVSSSVIQLRRAEDGAQVWSRNLPILEWPRVITDRSGTAYVYARSLHPDTQQYTRATLLRYDPTGQLLAMRTLDIPQPIVDYHLTPLWGSLFVWGALVEEQTGQDAFVARFPELIAGDTNGDGCVDGTDLLRVFLEFGNTGQNCADVNHDGVVDDSDLLSVLFHFGEGC